MTDCQVELRCPELYYPIRELAEKHGWGKRLDNCVYAWLIIKPHERKVTGNCSRFSDYPVISIFEAIELLKKGPEPTVSPIRIGDLTVEFTDSGIKVGSQDVSTATIDEIHKRVHASEGKA